MEQMWTSDVRDQVHHTLSRFFAKKHQRFAHAHPASGEVIALVEDFTLGGGKRLRPMVLYAGYRSLSGATPPDTLWQACSALELLQTYLLIHDDWMDQDELRRGQPSMHVALQKRYNDAHLGASLAVLAGDLASTYAWELMTSSATEEQTHRTLLETFGLMQEEVFFGQHLDLRQEGEPLKIYDLKTGSYTVRGPLLLGATFAGADASQLSALTAFANPLGLAFQMRDDWLGLFGDVKQQGKPVGNDLRYGKRTPVLEHAKARLGSQDYQKLQEVLGHPHVAADLLRATIQLLIDKGVKSDIEKQIADFKAQALKALEQPALEALEKHWLYAIADLMVERES